MLTEPFHAVSSNGSSRSTPRILFLAAKVIPGIDTTQTR